MYALLGGEMSPQDVFQARDYIDESECCLGIRPFTKLELLHFWSVYAIALMLSLFGGLLMLLIMLGGKEALFTYVMAVGVFMYFLCSGVGLAHLNWPMAQAKRIKILLNNKKIKGDGGG